MSARRHAGTPMGLGAFPAAVNTTWVLAVTCFLSPKPSSAEVLTTVLTDQCMPSRAVCLFCAADSSRLVEPSRKAAKSIFPSSTTVPTHFVS